MLVGFGLRMIAQERQLAEERVADEWLTAVGQIRQQLLDGLESIKYAELAAVASETGRIRERAYLNPEVRLISALDGGRVVLPWEETVGPRASDGLADRPFAGWIRQGELAEFRRGDYRTAIESYRRALDLGRQPVQSGHAMLGLARVLAHAQRDEESMAQYRRVLGLAWSVTDEQGTPLALYAATRLLDARLEQRQILDRLDAAIREPGWIAPGTAHMVRDLVENLIETSTEPRVANEARALLGPLGEEISAAEAALDLQREFPSLGVLHPELSTGTARSLWVPDAEGTWLVSSAALPGANSSVVVAVDANAMLVQLQDSTLWPAGQVGQVRTRTSDDASGLLLGAALPGLEVTFQGNGDGGDGWKVQRSFYAITLLLVLTGTFFGAFLVWRDVRRELRLADLRSQFVSSVSHELKTPLTSIRMFAETLQTREQADPATRAEYLGTIVGESERLTRLLNNVLDLSRIEQDRMVYRPRPTSIGDVTRRAVRALEYPLQQEGFSLDITGEEELPPVSVDPDALEQAILNLLTNAMKYSGDSRQIDLRLALEDGHAVIEVTDHGTGIAPHELERLTEKFYRVPTAENRNVPGTGLGLTLVDHMATAHGGELHVRSLIGEGSSFAIRLPLVDAT
jgi:signal transduction histidine kinase